MTDSFIIGTYWSSRPEPLITIVKKTQETLTNLSSVDEQFLNWFKMGMSRKKALESKLSLDNDNIEKICLDKVKKGELDGKGYAKMGFLFSLWTGQKEEEASSILFTVGGAYNTDKLHNSCVLRLPFDGIGKERLLQLNKAKEIINILIRIWNPDYAVLTSDNVRDRLDVGNNVGWITYRKSIKRVPRLSEKVIYEKNDLAHWFYLKTDGICYDYNLLEDLKSIKEII